MPDFTSVIKSPVCSLDRCTLLLYTGVKLSESEISKFLSDIRFSFQSCFDFDKRVSCSTELYKYHFQLKGDVDFQFLPKFGITVKIDDEGFIRAFGTDKQQEDFLKFGFCTETLSSDWGIRVEFNPNKSDLSICQSLLRYCIDTFTAITGAQPEDCIKYTRLDFCVDYPFKLIPTCFTCMKKTKYAHFGGSRGCETMYFGTRRSDFHYRIYDKKKELKEKQGIIYPGSELWRIELEFKKPFMYEEEFLSEVLDRFQDLDYYIGYSDDWFVEILATYCKQYGTQQALKLMPKRTRIRYRNLLDELSERPLKHPAEVFQEQGKKVYEDFKKQLYNVFIK